ncbi:MAG: hypothetical protein M3N00_00965 [Actinomycetota bacterium]|nr:hypothetical protein [Actinomycetota bacterium]
MLAMRKVALKALPLLVVLWAAFIVFGGALRLVEKAEPAEDSTIKTVTGFCTAFVALAASAYVVRAARRLDFFVKRTLARISYPCTAPVPAPYGRPPPPGPSILHLLQVLRT